MSDIDAKQLLQDLCELREELDRRADDCYKGALPGDQNFASRLAKANAYGRAHERLSSILENYGVT